MLLLPEHYARWRSRIRVYGAARFERRDCAAIIAAIAREPMTASAKDSDARCQRI